MFCRNTYTRALKIYNLTYSGVIKVIRTNKRHKLQYQKYQSHNFIVIFSVKNFRNSSKKKFMIKEPY